MDTAVSPTLNVERVPRIDRLTLAQFRAQYLAATQPVIITNGLDWPALGLWSHEWFASRYGAVEVELSVNPTHTRKVVKMQLGRYIERILGDDRMAGGLYLAQLSIERLPGLREYFSIPPYCSPLRKILPRLWVGPGTTIVDFHKDNDNPLVQVDNIFVQLYGRKQVLLVSPANDAFMYRRLSDVGAHWHSQVDPMAPDFERFPLLQRVRFQEALVGPGDMIFIPRNYWHYVRALDRSISMSFFWHPYRLMEVAAGLLQAKEEQAISNYGIEDRLVASDVDECGGVYALAQMFREFTDAQALHRLGSRLLHVADTEAGQVIRTALQLASSTS